MCEYCEGNETYPLINVNEKSDPAYQPYEAWVFIDDGKIVTENYPGAIARTTINYCPMCGEKLGEKQ